MQIIDKAIVTTALTGTNVTHQIPSGHTCIGAGVISDTEDVGAGFCHFHIRIGTRNHFIGSSSYGGKIGSYQPIYYYAEDQAQLVIRIFPKSAVPVRTYIILAEGKQTGSTGVNKQTEYMHDIYQIADDSQEIEYDEVTGNGAAVQTATLRPAANEKWLVLNYGPVNVDNTVSSKCHMYLTDGTNIVGLDLTYPSVPAAATLSDASYGMRYHNFVLTRSLYMIGKFYDNVIANTKKMRLSAVVIKLPDLQD